MRIHAYTVILVSEDILLRDIALSIVYQIRNHLNYGKSKN